MFTAFLPRTINLFLISMWGLVYNWREADLDKYLSRSAVNQNANDFENIGLEDIILS